MVKLKGPTATRVIRVPLEMPQTSTSLVKLVRLAVEWFGKRTLIPLIRSYNGYLFYVHGTEEGFKITTKAIREPLEMPQHSIEGLIKLVYPWVPGTEPGHTTTGARRPPWERHTLQ